VSVAPPLLVAITDLAVATEQQHLDAYAAAARALPVGTLAVQLRGHGVGGRRLLAFGRALDAALAGLGARLIVNDRLDLALCLGVTAVHLGGRSVSIGEARALLGAAAWISVACHQPADVQQAEREGADAAVLSPIFASPGKGAALGPGALAAARRLGPRVALLALGGVDAATAGACLDAGADGVAAIRGALSGGLAERLAELASKPRRTGPRAPEPR
jgi:thiamine-phosphate pyrophosphorylase